MAIDKSEKSEFIEQRIDELKRYFTRSLYQNVCRSLFEKHKLLFSFILTAKLKEAEGDISGSQFQFLISTVPGLENPLDLANPAEKWLPTNIWNKLCDLSQIEPVFNVLHSKFVANEDYYRRMFESNNPHREPFPLTAANLEFGLFEKLCILKVIRPDKLIPGIKEFVIDSMGEDFVSPPPFDLELSYNDSTSATPLIFVLPGADPL